MDEKQHITRGRGSAAGTILKILGVILIAVGVISGVSLPLIVVGVVVAGIGTSLSARKRSAADQQTQQSGAHGQHFRVQFHSFVPLWALVCAQRNRTPRASIAYSK